MTASTFADLGDGPFDLRELGTDDLYRIMGDATRTGNYALALTCNRIIWSRARDYADPVTPSRYPESTP